MGRCTKPIQSSEAPLVPAPPFQFPPELPLEFPLKFPLDIPFAADSIPRWAALLRSAVVLGWQFALAIGTAENQPHADHGAIGEAAAPIDAVPGNKLNPVNPNVGGGPAATTPLMGSLHGIIDEAA